MDTTALTWLGIALCVAQSACFSGLNLAVFGVSRLRLETEASIGDPRAARVLALRQDAHLLLTTILWGNVACNTLLAILSNSILSGVVAFVFSTLLITFVGEIIPQAYFSRNALRMAARLAPMLRVYQVILYPLAGPSAKLLDAWIGPEGIEYFRERGLRELIRQHIEAEEADLDRLEGLGALNFLDLDDLAAADEGERLDPDSVIPLPIRDGRPVFPAFERVAGDPFLAKLNRSRKKWAVLTDQEDQPQFVVDCDGFLRDALFDTHEPFHPNAYCHRPIVIRNAGTPLGRVLSRLHVVAEHHQDDVIDEDIILVWSEARRIITGADILGFLMRGIATPVGRAGTRWHH